MNRILYCLIFSIFSFTSAQVDSSAFNQFVEIHTSKANIFKEKIFLHTNKTTYFSGEKVWFKAYMVNDINNLPSYATTNLYINLYDSSYHLISSKLFFVENGSTYGEIEIPKESIGGDYYIETATLWSKNHHRETANFNKIKVIALDQKKEAKKITTTANESPLEITFYPESNLLLESLVNTIALKTLKNGTPISIKGSIVKSNQDEVAQFETNKFGLGACEFLYLPDEKYTVNTQGGSTFDLPIASKYGIAIHLPRQTNKHKEIELIIKTNENTLSTILDKQYYIVVHREDIVSYIAPLNFSNGYRQYLKVIDRDTFFDGLNEISIFDTTNKALAHRYLYFGNPEKRIDVTATVQSSISDSILINLDTKNHLLKNIKANLSVSVLPSESLNYENRKNILTSFLIAPYHEKGLDYASLIYGEEHPDDHLNLVMMTLEKMRLGFIWENSKNEPQFPSETGLVIQGKANFKNSKKEKHTVLLTSKENNIMFMEKLADDYSFVFDSLHLKYPSEYELSILDRRGKPVKAGFYIKSKQNVYIADNMLTDQKLIESISKEPYSALNTLEKTEESLHIPKVEQLDEVVLTAERKKLNFDHLLPTKKELGGSFNKTYEIKEGTQDDNSTLLHLIGNMPGVQSLMASGDVGEAKLSTTRGPRSITGDNYKMLIEINGIIIGDNSILHEIKASDVVEVKVNSLGAGYGVRGGNGVIQVKTKIGNDYTPKRQSDTKYYKGSISLGYATPLPYKDFPLEFQNADSEKRYGSIGWFPNVSYNNQESIQFKAPKTSSELIKLIINGMDANGAIIFKEINLDVDAKQME